VAPLNRLVGQINASRNGHLAPWFDPDGGGTDARVLFLLENPGRRATSMRGSGFISADNNDDTAANFFRMRDQVRPNSRLSAVSVYGLSSTVSCNIAAQRVWSSAPSPARIVATLTGWVMYGSPLRRN
jgi:hypothetical protein